MQLGIPRHLIERDLEVRKEYIALALGLTSTDLPTLVD